MYERILVAVDGSSIADAGLAEAIKLATLTGAQLRLLHVIDEMPFILSSQSFSGGVDVLGPLREAGEDVLQEARSRVKDSGIAVDTVLAESLNGRLCDHVAVQVKEWKADLIVLGTHGRRGVKRLFLGSDAEQVLRTATVPVLLVRAAEAAGAASTAAAQRQAA